MSSAVLLRLMLTSEATSARFGTWAHPSLDSPQEPAKHWRERPWELDYMYRREVI